MKRSWAGTLATGIAAFSLCAAPAGAAGTPKREPSPDSLLRGLAKLSTHGWVHEWWQLPDLEARLAQGKRIYVTCEKVTALGQRLLARYGYRSRIVVTMTKRRFNDIDNGHTMLEAWIRHRWVLYDLDGDSRAVDGSGRPIGLIRQLAAGRARRWQPISHDKRFDLRGLGEPSLSYAKAVYADKDRWYDRVLGVPLLETADGRYAFRDYSQRLRMEKYSSAYVWASKAEWTRLNRGE